MSYFTHFLYNHFVVDLVLLAMTCSWTLGNYSGQRNTTILFHEIKLYTMSPTTSTSGHGSRLAWYSGLLLPQQRHTSTARYRDQLQAGIPSNQITPILTNIIHLLSSYYLLSVRLHFFAILNSSATTFTIASCIPNSQLYEPSPATIRQYGT